MALWLELGLALKAFAESTFEVCSVINLQYLLKIGLGDFVEPQPEQIQRRTVVYQSDFRLAFGFGGKVDRRMQRHRIAHLVAFV